MVLGRAADHRRPADVDLLDDLVAGDARLPHRLAEAVEVDAQHVDGVDAVLDHRPAVALVVALAEQAAVHLRMQGLQAPVHQLGEAGVVGDLGDRQAGVEQRAGGATGRQQREAGVGETAGELDDALFVRDRQQRASHFFAWSFFCFR
jgi:hypothetical protein